MIYSVDSKCYNQLIGGEGRYVSYLLSENWYLLPFSIRTHDGHRSVGRKWQVPLMTQLWKCGHLPFPAMVGWASVGNIIPNRSRSYPFPISPSEGKALPMQRASQSLAPSFTLGRSIWCFLCCGLV